jgi:hypothetical protein
MYNHPVKKSAGLIVLYAVIIVGIFILQFRSNSVISHNIGSLQMSVDQRQDSTGAIKLKNRMQVSFKGIAFIADDIHPALLISKGSDSPEHLTLVSWEQTSPLAYRFQFTKNAAIVFSVSDTTDSAKLSITVDLPPDAESLTVLYKPITGYSVTDQTGTHASVSSKNNEYIMTAPKLQDNTISLLAKDPQASYIRHITTTAFSFADSTAGLPLAAKTAYDATITKFRNTLISAAQSALQEPGQLSENIIVAYVAEMAAQHRYNEALDSIPESFKKSTKRTYVSSPYFDSLTTMNASLERQIENTSSMINNAVDQKTLDIYAADNLADFLLRNSTAEKVLTLLSLPGKMQPFTPTLTQATGILSVYTQLKKADSPLAAKLEPVLNTCLSTIGSSCRRTNDKIELIDKDAPAALLQCADTASALIGYGIVAANTAYTGAGYLILNSAVADFTGQDIQTLANLYPVLIPDNSYYPHAVVLSNENGRPVWAWTVAHSINYKKNGDGTEAEIEIEFPQGDTHYLIINGISSFKGIDIYNMPFRTDPRFETYNSSGYVYNADKKLLLLKSRQKSAVEVIKLHYN